MKNYVYIFALCLSSVVFANAGEDSTTILELQKKMEMMASEISNLKETCNCNLTGLEHNIRQNGIEIAKVRHLVVLNNNRISENLDEINENQDKIIENQDKINENQVAIETKVETVKSDLEASIDQVKVSVEQNIADLNTAIDKNTNKISDLVTLVGTRVIFSAIRKGDGDVNSGEIITLTEMEVNVGQGMNPDTGEFTVPVTGVYSFSLSARTNDDDPNTNVAIYKNDVYQFRISNYNGEGHNYFTNLSYAWTFVLTKGDKLHLKLTKNGLDVYGEDFIWFNGQLLMAQ